MKKSVIKDIFTGRRGQLSSIRMPKDYGKSLSTSDNIYAELKEKLTPELFDLFQEYVDGIHYDFGEEIDFYFAEGFKLGLLAGIECAEDD